jgi:hypothetical protein
MVSTSHTTLNRFLMRLLGGPEMNVQGLEPTRLGFEENSFTYPAECLVRGITLFIHTELIEGNQKETIDWL